MDNLKESFLLVTLLVLLIVFLKWVYAITYPRKEIKIKANGEIIKRNRKWFSLKPRDVIYIRPKKGAGHYNIRFEIPPDMGEVSFQIMCSLFRENEYTVKNEKSAYHGKPV